MVWAMTRTMRIFWAIDLSMHSFVLPGTSSRSTSGFRSHSDKMYWLWNISAIDPHWDQVYRAAAAHHDAGGDFEQGRRALLEA